MVFAIAAGIMLFNALLHTFVGGARIAQPLVEDRQLPAEVRETMLYCWHVTTWVLFCSAAGYASAWWSGEAIWAVVASVATLGFALIGVIRPMVRPVRYGVLPQGWLFVPVLIAAGWGLVAGP